MPKQVVSYRLEPALIDRIKQVSQAQGCTATDIVCSALTAVLDGPQPVQGVTGALPAVQPSNTLVVASEGTLAAYDANAPQQDTRPGWIGRLFNREENNPYTLALRASRGE